MVCLFFLPTFLVKLGGTSPRNPSTTHYTAVQSDANLPKNIKRKKLENLPINRKKPLSNQRFQRKFGNPKNVVVFLYVVVF